MKYKLFLFLTVLTVMLSCSYAYASDLVRVGLEKNFNNVASVVASNNDINLIANGKSYNVNNSGGYTIKPISKNYYKLNETFDSYQSVSKKMPSFTGYSCVPTLTSDGWTIYFTKDKKPSVSVSEVSTTKNAIVFSNGGVNKFIADLNVPCKIASAGGILNLNGGNYRDSFEFDVNGNTIMGVNVIDIEHYLYGVINSEMPSSWSLEAQKAQAVAARTFVLYTGNKHDTYDLCDNTNCQDYNGTAKETEIGRQAVDETKGIAIYYDNKPIDAVYFSSDGGATINSEDVWVSALPYLKGISDSYEKECKEWTRTYTYSDLTNMCNKKGFNIGSVTGVTAEYNSNGLCTSITFKGTSGSKTVTKDQIRTVFNATSDGSLLSRNFVISSADSVKIPSVFALGKDGGSSLAINSITAKNSVGESSKIKDSTYTYSDGKESVVTVEKQAGTSGADVTITGRGYGHGVGMSQYGAKGMAEEGYTFKEILEFYYNDVEVK